MRNKRSLVGLGALAVVTLVLMALALAHIRPNQTAAEPAAPGMQPAAVQSPSESPPSARPREARASSADNIRSLIESGDPARIVVLGDGTGADDAAGTARWVSTWAGELARQRPVHLKTMGPDGAYAGERRLGPSTGAPLEILNASDRPSRLSEITASADRLIPADADVVIVNVGHHESPTSLARDLASLRNEFPQGAMGLVMLQNPQRGNGASIQQARVQIVRQWADQAGFPTVDVYRTFLDHPLPLAQLLGADRVNPNTTGSELWSATVVAALG